MTTSTIKIAKAPSSKWLIWLLENAIFVALALAIMVFSVASPDNFFTTNTFIAVLRFASLGGILVAFFTCAMIAGQLDLSALTVGALGAMVFAVCFQVLQLPLVLALIIALGIVALFGALNSFLIHQVQIPSLVTTLAVGTLAYGVSYLLLDAFGTSNIMRLSRPPLRSLINTEVLGLPISIILMFACYFILYIVLNHTKLGSHIYAVGANANAARLNGVWVSRVIYFVLVSTAIAAGFATIMLGGRQLAVTPLMAVTSAPLVAALFAGVSLSGGSGRIERTLVGVLFFAVLGIGLSILALPSWVRFSVEGLAFILALLTDSIRNHLETR
jgi:ribose transport system permease protein